MKNYLTPIGFKRLADERDHLLKVERPEVCKVVAWAAANGDRSENADYQYGKKRLREIDKRLYFLSSRLDDVQVVDPATINSEKVQFGAKVTLEGEEGEKKTYFILGPDEIDLQRNRISYMSPIGKAVMGKTVGDFVVVHSPKGEQEFEIKDIKYEPINH